MPTTVTLDAWTGRTVSDVPIYAQSPVEFPARIEIKNRMIRDSRGNEVVSHGRVFLGTRTVPSVKDKLTLPPEFQSTTPTILDAYPVYDENGIHHVTLEIK
jgi:hypothetical protein